MRTPRLLRSLLLAIVLVALPLATVLAAPLGAVEVKLTQSTLRVGDQVTLRVSVTHPGQATVSFPDLNGKLGFVEMVRFLTLPPARSLDGTTVTTGEYVITSFVPGRFNIPAITVSYTMPDGAVTTTTSTEALMLEVHTVLTNTDRDELRDIKPPLSIGRDPSSYASTAAAIVLGLGAAGLSAVLMRRTRRRPAVIGAALDLSLEGAAHAELDAISEIDLTDRASYVEYCSRISATVRRYLDLRFNLSLAASTTTEIRALALTRTLDPWQARVIANLLDECDGVRWAQHHPDRQRVQRLVSMAHEIIDLAGSKAEPEESEISFERPRS